MYSITEVLYRIHIEIKTKILFHLFLTLSIYVTSSITETDVDYWEEIMTRMLLRWYSEVLPTKKCRQLYHPEEISILEHNSILTLNVKRNK